MNKETIIVENSAHPGAIGDTIAAFPALAAYAWRAATPVEVYLACAAVRPLLPKHPYIVLLDERPKKGMMLDVQQIAGAFIHSGMSMSQGYLDAIGLKDVARIKVPELQINIGQAPDQMPQYDVILAPFSHSDNGTNTKIWPREKWQALVSMLWQLGLTIGLVGTNKDINEWGFWKDEPVIDIIDMPLQVVGHFLRNAKVVVSTDNGINWMCQGLWVKHILMLPMTAHPNWTANLTRNGMNVPITIEVTPIFNAIRDIINGDKGGQAT